MTIYTKRQLISFVFHVVIITVIILFFRAVRSLAYNIPDPCGLKVVVCDEETITIIRTITAYTASVNETDDTPCIAARNYNICEDKTIKVVATNEYPIGTQLLIDNVPYTVLDRMNKRYPNRYDILVGTREEAMAFGIQEKNIEIIKSQ